MRDPIDKTISNNKIQRLRREIQKLKEEKINLYLQNLSANVETGIFALESKNIKRPITSIPPIRKDAGPWNKNNKTKLQKAILFAEYLADIFTSNLMQMDNVLAEVDNQKSENITPVTPKEVVEENKTKLK